MVWRYFIAVSLLVVQAGDRGAGVAAPVRDGDQIRSIVRYPLPERKRSAAVRAF
jgi:hypothetical protein